MADRYFVTLVHGTWAPNSSWTLPQSEFRLSLERRLDGEVEYNTFAWNGDNDEAARADAAQALSRQVSKAMSSHAESAHFIIAHSHGGNIALRIGSDVANATPLKGIVTLATPYFDPTPRDVVAPALYLLRGLCWFFGSMTLVFLVARLWPGFVRSFDRMPVIRSSSDTIWWTALATGAVIAAILLRQNRQGISEWIRRRQRRRIVAINLPPITVAHVLSMSVRGDEVMLAFRALDFLSKMSILLLRPNSIAIVTVLSALVLLPYGNQAYEKVTTLIGGSLGVIVTYPFLPFAILAEAAAAALHIPISFAFPLATVVLSAITITVLSVVSFFAAAVVHVALKLLPFGMRGWRFLDTYFLQISPRTTPPGTDKVEKGEIVMPRSGLMHSSIYRSEECLDRISDFMKKAVAVQ
ncbi:MAG: alpha/beta fold hydrolase [Hyphomicrobiaceae bacterium]